jgi:hypothetical protein
LGSSTAVEVRSRLGNPLPCHSAFLRVSYRFASERLRDHRIDLIAVEGPLRVIDQRLREGEHDSFVNRDEAAPTRPESF